MVQPMAAEKPACEEHFLIHTARQMEDLWIDFHSSWNPISLGHLTSLQSDDYMQLNANWSESQTSILNTTNSQRNMKKWVTGN
jgi:hypothetical protein